MATYKVLYWQEVPSQIKAEDDADDVTLQMPDRFQERIDRLAAERGLGGLGRLPGAVALERGRGSRRLGAGRGRGRARRARGEGRLVASRLPPRCADRTRCSDSVPATLTMNGQTTAAVPGLTLFEHAERLGVRVPTSCRKQGKCKECLVEVTAGHGRAVAADAGGAAPARHTSACRAARRSSLTTRDVRCHTMRRGQMRVLDRLRRHRGAPRRPGARSGGDARRRSHPDRRRGSARSTGPIHGLAMDLGTTTVVLRLFDLETGELVADASFENPQRFGGSDVMARIQYDTEHGGFLLMRTLAGYISHAIEEFPVDPQTIYELIVVGNSTMRDLFFRPERVLDRPEPVPVDHRDRDGRGQARHAPAWSATGRAAAAADPSRRRASTACRSSAATSAPTPRRACSRSIWPTRIALIAIMDIGTNTELIARQPRPHPGGVLPGRPGVRGRRDLLRHAGARRRHRDGRGARRTARSRSA